jgi:hypothetical protein
MMAIETNPNKWIDRLPPVIRNDPKKAGIISILALVMLVMWGRLLVGGPNAAVASLTRVLQGGNPTAPAAGPQRQTAGNALLDWLNAKKRPSARNLFAVNLDYFPREAGKKSGTDNGADSKAGFWDEMAKSMSAQADQKRERQVLVENLQTQAAALKLQSTVMSTPPQALINGQLVQQGDMIDSFRVAKIEPRRIIVEQDGVKLEIGFGVH